MATDTRLRVSKRERKLHLSYELPHRIHTSHIYPVAAPNGSIVIAYGYDKGLRILWRGGRRHRPGTTAHTQPNGGQSTEIMMLDGGGDDDEPSPEHNEADNNDFEAEEEELDPDCPYPSITQSLDLPTGSPVLHVALPSLSPAAATPRLLRRVALFVIASADGALRLLQVPLKPPADEQKDEAVSGIVQSQVELASAGAIPTALSIKYTPVDSQPLLIQKKQKENVEGQLLVAASSRTLSVWSVSVTADAVVAEDKTLLRKVPLQQNTIHLAFHPLPRSTQLLLAGHDGIVQIYDPYALKTPPRRPGSSDSTLEAPTSSAEPGKWIMAFYTPYNATKDVPTVPTLARRKKILDAKWILSGKGILTVLEDGQWGIWDASSSSNPHKGIETFAFDGFLEAASSSHLADSSATKKGSSKLAPMTPNTRKTRTEHLFAGAPKAPGVAAKGGISVTSTYTRTGLVDESVTLWYDSEVFSITSTQAFWQRSNTNSGAIGSLYAPGLSHITDIDLSNESITSISQFSAKTSSAGIGQMNTQRDLLISAERRMLVLQALRPPTPARTLFQVAERPASREKPNTVLSDIDRALEDMAAGASVARRVGFAAH